VATALAGGYARRVEDTIRIHVNTILAAREVALAFPMVSASGRNQAGVEDNSKRHARK